MQGHSFPETGASATPQVASHAAAALASLDAMRHDLSVTHDALLALSNETEQLRHIVATNEGRSSGLQHELETLRIAYEQGQSDQKLLQSENARLEQLNQEAGDENARLNALVAQSARETLAVQSDLNLALDQLKTVRQQLQGVREEFHHVQHELENKSGPASKRASGTRSQGKPTSKRARENPSQRSPARTRAGA
jgi:chromosome segregation ATPase